MICGITGQYASKFDVLTLKDLCKVLDYVVHWYNVSSRNNKTSGMVLVIVLLPFLRSVSHTHSTIIHSPNRKSRWLSPDCGITTICALLPRMVNFYSSFVVPPGFDSWVRLYSERVWPTTGRWCWFMYLVHFQCWGLVHRVLTARCAGEKEACY